MSSPFPGMDPYLEGEMWQEFHETLASAIRAQLMPQIAPRYAALLAKRYVVDRPALGIFDVPPQPPLALSLAGPGQQSPSRPWNCPAWKKCRNSVSKSATWRNACW
jgi:hypothetical protein